jgi:hypothetical protein
VTYGTGGNTAWPVMVDEFAEEYEERKAKAKA